MIARQPLGQVSRITMGQSPKGDTYNNDGEGLPLLNGPTEFGHTHPYCTSFTTDPKRRCERGDLIFCVRGSTTGRMNWADTVYALGRGVCSFKGATHLETRFIRYAVEDQLKALLQLSTGASTFPNLSKVDLHKFEIAWPDDRYRIASILSAYDDLIENNTRRIAILEEMARRLYDEWFVQFRFPGHEGVPMVDSEIGKVPEGWEVAPLSDLTTLITDGAHKSPKSTPDGSPMASVKDMHDWGINLQGCRKISPADFEELIRNNCKPLKGDILIAKDGSYLKHSFLVEREEDVVLLSSIAILRPNGFLNSELFSIALRDDNVRARMKGFVSGVAIPRIVLKDFRKFKIHVPPKDLQSKWADTAQPMLSLCRRLIDKNTNLRTQRDLLLPKLISGEIDVSEVDEPTEEVAA